MNNNNQDSRPGFLSIILHAHLPFVRHPEYSDMMEERWLYEAITETYIPLIDVFYKLLNEGIDFRITMTLTPPLLNMLFLFRQDVVFHLRNIYRIFHDTFY